MSSSRQLLFQPLVVGGGGVVIAALNVDLHQRAAGLLVVGVDLQTARRAVLRAVVRPLEDVVLGVVVSDPLGGGRPGRGQNPPLGRETVFRRPGSCETGENSPRGGFAGNKGNKKIYRRTELFPVSLRLYNKSKFEGVQGRFETLS